MLKENTIYYYGHASFMQIYFKDNVCFANEEFTELLKSKKRRELNYWFSFDKKVANKGGGEDDTTLIFCSIKNDIIKMHKSNKQYKLIFDKETKESNER